MGDVRSRKIGLMVSSIGLLLMIGIAAIYNIAGEMIWLGAAQLWMLGMGVALVGLFTQLLDALLNVSPDADAGSQSALRAADEIWDDDSKSWRTLYKVESGQE